MRRIGTVAALWRYPVKSMRGDPLTRATFDPHGLVGDRRFAFISTAAPAGKPLLASRERTAMLRYTPRLDPEPHVLTPAGRRLPLPSPELLADLQTTLATPGASLSLETSPDLPLTDVRPVSLVSTATLQRVQQELGYPVDPQRFRSNLILALDPPNPCTEIVSAATAATRTAFAEDAFAGSTLLFGGPHGPSLRVHERIPRCRMVSLDPVSVTPDPLLLPHLARQHEGRLGMYASVIQTGEISVGQVIFLA